MKWDGRMAHEELQETLLGLAPMVEGRFLKKVYHYEGYWQFSFNKGASFVVQPGYNLWVGEFREREKLLHSVCIKLRKEVGDQRVLNIHVFGEKNRKFSLRFTRHTIVFELFAKGNVILVENETGKIIVLTRFFKDISHGNVYDMAGSEPLFSNVPSEKTVTWKKATEFVVVSAQSAPRTQGEKVWEANGKLWKEKYKTLFRAAASATRESIGGSKAKEGNGGRRNKSQVVAIQRQLDKLEQLLTLVTARIETMTMTTSTPCDYAELGKQHTERKTIQQKIQRGKEHLESATAKEASAASAASAGGATGAASAATEVQENRGGYTTPTPTPALAPHTKWYHSYHWWHTKSGFLVVGGRNADQNERLVKTYLGKNDIYFHSEAPGSGSFVMFGGEGEGNAIDIHETAGGVLSLSGAWKAGVSSGTVYYVKGSQVCKTPPTGTFVTKGSFMIQGEKTYVKVDDLSLGYTVTEKSELLLAPYPIVRRVAQANACAPFLRLRPRAAKKGNAKEIVVTLKRLFNLRSPLPEDAYIFNHPCSVFVHRSS